MSKQTTLGEAQITPSPHDVVTIELVKPDPDDMPAFVRIAWPLHPTLIEDPRRFPEAAATIVRLFSEAHITLARIKAWGRL